MEDPKPQDAAPHPKKQHQIRLRRLSTSRSYSQSSASAGCSGVDARNSSSAVINQRARIGPRPALLGREHDAGMAPVRGEQCHGQWSKVADVLTHDRSAIGLSKVEDILVGSTAPRCFVNRHDVVTAGS